MPATDIVFYRDNRGRAPVLEWLNEVRKSDRKGWAKCVARIEDLSERGYELDRPHAALLEGGLYELRVRHVNTQYRILYFFCQRLTTVLAVGLTKSDKRVSPAAINLAMERQREFETDPEGHTWKEA